MEEGREPPPEQETRRAPIAAGTRLAPPQEAFGAYTDHAVACLHCRDIDRSRCHIGDGLWHAYLEISDAAYRRLGGGA